MVLIFKSWPLLNTMTTYAILWTASDITQELVVSKKDHVDWGKTARIGTTGACVIAPLVLTWIRIVELMFPGSAMKMVLKKVVIEQICFTPVTISSFYLATNALEGKSGIPELEAKFKKTYQAGMTFWPFVQMVNFRFVSHHYKPVFTASASFVWTIFLCYMKEEKVQAEPEQPSKAFLQSLPAKD
ncbi:mpv17-like protein isoform X1 [Littorina saxatilis]|uniref:Mitochondrial inner membrane protein Mpv17 n=1 Tax=Littorina saxatilis TaxID=31220 RepID=A0AAN9GNM3_9CAEN